MKKFKIGLIVGATIMIIVNLTIIDYSNMTSSKNFAFYLMLPGLIYAISSLIISIRNDKKQQSNLTDNNR